MSVTIEQIQQLISDLKTSTENGVCSIANITTQIAELNDQLRGLLIEKAQTESNFNGLEFVIKLGNAQIPTLVGSSAPIAGLINAIGKKPSNIEIDGVTITVNGSSGLTLSVAGNTDPEEVALILNAFVLAKGITLNPTQAISIKEGNEERARQFLTLAELQSSVISLLMDDGQP